MKRYPAYKNSGVDYLNNVPDTWKVCRLKHASIINPTKGSSQFSGVKNDLVTFLQMENVHEDGLINTDIKKPIYELCRNVNRKLTPYDNLILTPLNFKHNSSPLP